MMRILLLDIETSPNLAYVWGLFKQNVAINQIKESGSVLCWAAKWLGEERIHFDSVKKSGEQAMLERIHKMVDQADAVVHYNGKSFDLPSLNREWLRLGMPPPSPAKHIDLLHVARHHFRFTSNKLDYVSKYLGLGQKEKTNGFELWTDCMAGKREAWRQMEAYNRQDVALLESLYLRLLPWIDRHPSHGAVDDEAVCPKCGGAELQPRGYAYTSVHKYRRYQCASCKGWLRGNRTLLAPRRERILNAAA